MALQSLRGSMRSVVGKRICPLIEYAIFPPLPRIIVCASRGARMQRGNYSLIKKPKKFQLYGNINQLKALCINPYNGSGKGKSFGMLGDIFISEPDMHLAFVGSESG
uniref:Acetyl-CoA carboxylase carboxyltransferase beta subunit n=1 Tax=Oryza meyeriana TaxID=83307 RepID=A0A1W5HQA9_9ORYZ|nr:acetyl-CoA carboxylase carboxyltransferase beta subunit [Oryza meyeriana]AGY94858.1 acetyl-CoA carboxylase carboxyltransferase beta subunit [Oryza meyeriana]